MCIRDRLNGSIADSYKEALYSQAYSSYSSGDYQSAIPTFQKLVGMDEAYRDGSAAYYLAQSFRKSGDLASAKQYYCLLYTSQPSNARTWTCGRGVSAMDGAKSRLRHGLSNRCV